MRNGIICGGTLVFDLIKSVDQYPEEGMLGTIISEHKNGGGAPFNVLIDLAVMDDKLPLYIVGLLGDDEYGRYLEYELKKYNIDCKNLITTNKIQTACTDVIASKQSGSRTFFHRKGSNTILDIEHFRNLDESAKIFHLGYLMILDMLDSFDSNFGTRAAKLLSQMRELGYIVTADIVSVENENFEELISCSAKYIDYLIINEIEAEKSSNIITRINGKISESGLEKSAIKILALGVHKAVVIHYPEGCFAISSHGKKIILPSINISDKELKGTVGAGDAFCAGMLYGIHEDYDLEESMKLANASAWFSLKSETSTGGAVPLKLIQKKICDLSI